jgi:hypothetical protein
LQYSSSARSRRLPRRNSRNPGDRAAAAGASKFPTPKTDIDARALEKAVPEPAPLRARPADNSVLLDRVIAIVNDEALTQYDINEQTRTIVAQMKVQKVMPPAPKSSIAAPDASSPRRR